MQVSQEKLLQYIHFNRQYNTLLIEHNSKLVENNTKLIQHNTELINQLRTEMETVKATQPSTQLEVASVQAQSGESKQISLSLFLFRSRWSSNAGAKEG